MSGYSYIVCQVITGCILYVLPLTTLNDYATCYPVILVLNVLINYPSAWTLCDQIPHNNEAFKLHCKESTNT